MIRRGHVVAIALVLLCNAVALFQVARDRREPPRADLWLTERELPVLPPEQESSVLLLRAALERRGRGAGGAVRRAEAARPGSDCTVPASSDEARAH